MNIILSCIQAFHSSAIYHAVTKPRKPFIYVTVNPVAHDTRHVKFNTHYIHLTEY